MSLFTLYSSLFADRCTKAELRRAAYPHAPAAAVTFVEQVNQANATISHFYKEQHVIDRSLARKRLYFNFDWLGFPAPPNTPPPPSFPPKKEGEGGIVPKPTLWLRSR